MVKSESSADIDFSRISKILIVRLGKIGDLVVTSCVFEVLKSLYPNLQIHLFTLESNRAVLKYNPRLNKIIYSKKNIFLYFNILKLRAEKYDMILDFNDNASTTSAIIFRYVKAAIKVSYDFGKYRRYLNFRITPLAKEKSHIIERMQNFLSQLGLEFDSKLVKPFFYIGSEELKDVKDDLRSSANLGKTIAINLSAGAKIRYWGEDKWLELIKLIEGEYKNFTFILLSTKEDSQKRHQIADSIKGIRHIIGGRSSIQHFAAYIKSANLLITPDTSAVHIASSFNVPTIALYPNPQWNFVSWQPYSVVHRSIRSETENVSDISVQEVFTKFKSVIKEIGLT